MGSSGVEMQGGNALIMLGQDDWKKGRDRVKGEGVRIYFTTEEDIDQIAADITSRGGTLAQEPKDQPWGMRDIALVDPLAVRRQHRADPAAAHDLADLDGGDVALGPREPGADGGGGGTEAAGDVVEVGRDWRSGDWHQVTIVR